MNISRILFVLIAQAIFLVDGKVSKGKVLLTGENSVALITKFAVSANQSGSFKMELKIPTSAGMYTDERMLKVSLFNEEKDAWRNAKKKPLCSEKVRYASDHKQVVFNSKEMDGKQFWVANVEANLPAKDSHMYWYMVRSNSFFET